MPGAAMPQVGFALAPALAAVGGGTVSGGQSSNSMLATMLVVLGIVMMAILISMSMRHKMARRQAQQLSPRERIEQIKAGAEARGRRSGLSPESVDAAQSLATRLDNKAERLELLLEEAEVRIAELKSLLASLRQEGSPAAPQSVSPHPSDEPAARRQPVSELDPLSQSVYALADSGKSATQIAQQLEEQIGKVELILALRRA